MLLRDLEKLDGIYPLLQFLMPQPLQFRMDNGKLLFLEF